MKIWCDMCGKDEAVFFCTADEAALCRCCDHRVHHANKLASKHQRFSFSSSSKDFPICDVCQEKRAFLFCQQDRAILCIECDVLIHTANDHTLKHSRFLLTGVKFSALPYTSAEAQSPAFHGIGTVQDFKLAEASSAKKLSAPNSAPLSKAAHHGKCSTSSISEYLIDMLPGWHFEEFIDTCSDSFGFYKSVGNDYGGLFSPEDQDDSMSSSFLSSESLGTWVPQAPPPIISAAPTNYHTSGVTYGVKEAAAITKQRVNVRHNGNNKTSMDSIFAVPQIRPPPSGLKRTRHFY
ncbi:hypothetical protein SAY86_016537 [Trapa natans]|uniref:B box-type domain-containing protein n=1 Tax=Trapa natans TaxID=22666 RepID=A0AAN7QZZ7_TRANT|nr:hypothetical protein SAY86_016537 [Trapa natans]